MIHITWYEPTDYGFRGCHYVCDKLGAYEYDELLATIQCEGYDYEIDYNYEPEEIEYKKNVVVII